MIVFCAIATHSPLLCPTSPSFRLTTKTQNGFSLLEQNLYASKPECILILSSHTPTASRSFLINLHPTYSPNLRQLGDFTHYQKFASDIETIAALTSNQYPPNSTLQTISHEMLDYDVSIPLIFLCVHLKNMKIIPLYTCLQDPLTHLEFGRALMPILHRLNRRIAVVASVDLSKETDSFEFDNIVLEKISYGNLVDISQISKKLVSASHSCAQKPLSLLAGILNGAQYRSNIISYEVAGSTGLVTAELSLS